VVEIISALKYPLKDIRKFLIGCIISYTSIVLLFPIFFILGYFSKALHLIISGKEELPDWKNFLKMFIAGAYVMLIFLGYTLPAILLSLANWGAYVIYRINHPLVNIEPSALLFNPVYIISAILFIIGTFLTPMGVCIFADKKKITTPFNMDFFSKKMKKKWIRYIASTLFIFYLLIIPYFLLSLIGIVGVLIYVPMSFYILLVGTYFFGKIYKGE